MLCAIQSHVETKLNDQKAGLGQELLNEGQIFNVIIAPENYHTIQNQDISYH